MNISNILNDLENYKHLKSQLKYDYISERLSNNLNIYNEELKSKLQYLKRKKPDSVLRKLK